MQGPPPPPPPSGPIKTKRKELVSSNDNEQVLSEMF